MDEPDVGSRSAVTMQKFLQLPTEIISRIVSFHDTDGSFGVASRQKPKSCRVEGHTAYSTRTLDGPPTTSESLGGPLKQLSLTSRFLHTLTLPLLFKHVVVLLLHPRSVDDFLAVLDRHDLAARVCTLVAHVPASFNHLHPAWWARLLNATNATKFGVVAPPGVLADLAGVPAWTSDMWAFDMPLQILTLQQSPPTGQIDYDDLPNLLSARPWTDMVVNEGSSLAAYTTYEFFLRRTPSLLTALHFHHSRAADRLFARLRSFEFVAIFPFYNHVGEILKCVEKMKRLGRLSVKLCPDPDSTVFEDEIALAGGSMDINDPWNECTTSWTLVAQTVVFLSVDGALRELCMHDVKVEGVREALEASLTARLGEGWTYEGPGSGIWRRKSSPLISPPAPV